MKEWITLNEPWVTAVMGYGSGEHAPGVVGIGTKAYVAGHNQLLAHARAYHKYKDDYKATQKGKNAALRHFDAMCFGWLDFSDTQLS